MCSNVNIVLANPAGNKTVFVLDSMDSSQYKDVAEKLLSDASLGAEQVGFIQAPIRGGQGRMEMCGHEFCGNASRSYGLYLGKQLGMTGLGKVEIEVSGISENLEVELDVSRNYTKISMPLPKGISLLQDPNYGDIPLVVFDGIIHAVLFDAEADLDLFHQLKDRIQQEYNSPAIGVMFCNSGSNFITPVVWVRDVNSTFYEGSCGSGSAAVVAILSTSFSDGVQHYQLPQPEGTLSITAEKRGNLLHRLYLEGEVDLSLPITFPI